MQVRSQFKEHKQLIASISAEMSTIEKIVKDEDPTGSAETGENKRTSISMMSKAVQERFVANEIHAIVRAGLDYEDVVSTHDALVEVPDDLVAKLSHLPSGFVRGGIIVVFHMLQWVNENLVVLLLICVV